MPYLDDSTGITVYDPSELGITAEQAWDHLTDGASKAFDWMKTGAQADAQALVARARDVSEDAGLPPPPSFVDEHASLIVWGGAGLIAYLLLRK